MNSVQVYADNLKSQWDRLSDLAEYDQYLAGPEAWKRRTGRVHNGCRRRGWTRQDKNRYEFGLLVERSTLLDLPYSSKRMGTRLNRYLTMWDLLKPSSDCAQEAIDYVSDLPQFAPVIGPAITEMHNVHVEWVNWMREQPNEGSDAAYKWPVAKAKLDGMCAMLIAFEKVAVNPVGLVERDLKPRHDFIWTILKKRGRRSLWTNPHDIKTELDNAPSESPCDVETIGKYLRQIKAVCERHSLVLEANKEPGTLIKYILKI